MMGAIVVAVGFAGSGCEDNGTAVTDETPAIPVGPGTVCPCDGDCSAVRTLNFAGYTWQVRQSSNPLQAGQNCYSGGPEEVWVDAQGRLHLKTRKRNNIWVCPEIYCTGFFGYGTYVFYVSSRVDTLDRNVVLGLFTWDDAALAAGSLSEIDVEITKWGNEFAHNLNYTVQPGYGPDTENHRYEERMNTSFMTLAQDQSTHVIDWTADRIKFASYQGYGISQDRVIATWQFDKTNPARRSDAETLTTPIVIPAPSATSGVHLNLWLKDVTSDGYGDPPASGEPVEVILDGFEFAPAT